MPEAPDPALKSRAVREMFGSIAGRYDFLNHLLSLNVDRRWRAACVRAIRNRLATGSRDHVVLDVGCGTGDLALALSVLGTVVGCDFSHPMLCVAEQKVRRRKRNSTVLVEADALTLPFPDSCFDVVASAFVLRNLADADRGMREMRRVLRKGGVAAVLDFSMPRVPVIGAAYRVYFHRVLPAIGRFISGVDGPYRYLPESVQVFPEPDELAQRASNAGWTAVESRPLTGGIAFLLLGSR